MEISDSKKQKELFNEWFNLCEHMKALGGLIQSDFNLYKIQDNNRTANYDTSEDISVGKRMFDIQYSEIKSNMESKLLEITNFMNESSELFKNQNKKDGKLL